MLLRDVMTRSLEEIPPQATLQEAAERMKDRDIGVLPVCEGDQLYGIVTDRDITVRAIAEGRDPKTTSVQDAMTPGVVFCFEDEDVQRAAELMERKQIRRLLVLDRNRRPTGIISLGDIATRTHDERLSGEALEQISEPGHPRQMHA